MFLPIPQDARRAQPSHSVQPPAPSTSLHAASDGKLSCPWKAPEARLPDANWERWRAAAERLQLFNADPDSYIKQHGYYS